MWDNIFTENEWGQYPSEHVVRFCARNLYRRVPRSEVMVLDFGCGPGANLDYLIREGFNVFGVDSSEVAIKKAKRNVWAKLKWANVYDRIWPNEFFDAVIDSKCLYNLPLDKAEDSIKIAYDYLKPNGLFFSNTYSSESTKFLKYNRLSEFEFDDGGERGYFRTIDANGINNLYGKYFEIISLEKVIRILNGEQVADWIIYMRKKAIH